LSCLRGVSHAAAALLGIFDRGSLDTTTPGGKLVFHVFGAVAEFERDIIRERTMAGLEAARARGRKGGRKPVMDERKLALASAMLKNREIPIGDIPRQKPPGVCVQSGWPQTLVSGTLPFVEEYAGRRTERETHAESEAGVGATGAG